MNQNRTNSKIVLLFFNKNHYYFSLNWKIKSPINVLLCYSINTICTLTKSITVKTLVNTGLWGYDYILKTKSGCRINPICSIHRFTLNFNHPNTLVILHNTPNNPFGYHFDITSIFLYISTSTPYKSSILIFCAILPINSNSIKISH